jgi:hypothetical protein
LQIVLTKAPAVLPMGTCSVMIVSLGELFGHITNSYQASWFDHSRDLLNMVNHFRDRMVQPIFGIGHSMGAAQLSETKFKQSYKTG